MHSEKKYAIKQIEVKIRNAYTMYILRGGHMAVINLRIDDEEKKNVERILSELGLTTTTAIKLFFNAVVREEGIPFNITLSTNKQGKVFRAVLDDFSGAKQMDTGIFSKVLVAYLLKNKLGAKTRNVTDNRFVDMLYEIGEEKFACIIKGRQFSDNESLQDVIKVNELEELYSFSQMNDDRIPQVAFVMIEKDGSSIDVYLFNPKDFTDLIDNQVKGITGSIEEGEFRVSNALRNRKDLQSNDKIIWWDGKFKN